MPESIQLKTREGALCPVKIHNFPDGEMQCELLNELDRKQKYILTVRIRNGIELFLVDQMMDILDRNEVCYQVDVLYLMSMRMDRVMSFTRPFSLKLVASVFNKHNPHLVTVVTPHSSRTCFEINHSSEREAIWNILNAIPNVHNEYQLVFPDKGAKDRYQEFERIFGDTICCDKKRNIQTGKIEKLEILPDEDLDTMPTVKDKVLIIDDLCDGGGTFLGLYDILKEKNPNAQIDLATVHAVQAQGIINVCQKFDNVYITDSYTDWNQFQENLHIIHL